MSLVSKTYSNGSRKSSLYCPFNFSVNLRKGKELKEKVILSLAWEYSCATVKRKVREIIWDMGKMGMDLCRFSRWTWALGDHQLRRLVSLGNNVLVQVEGEEVSFSSVSHSVVSSSLRPHELQHTRPPCPSQTPRVYSNSCPLSRWCHPAISSYVVPFSSCPQSLPASGSKNWCFWTVVLGKTHESPLDGKDIQPVHPKGNQSWVFIGRTDAEAETPILWPPDAKSWLIGKDISLGGSNYPPVLSFLKYVILSQALGKKH